MLPERLEFIPKDPKLLPTEEDEQIALLNWANVESRTRPELALLYHIPNGGKRSKREAARFKAAGVKSGVPDIFLPVPRGGYHGLYIELKRLRGGTVSREQKEWHEALKAQGYAVQVCKGWIEAAYVLDDYLKG